MLHVLIMSTITESVNPDHRFSAGHRRPPEQRQKRSVLRSGLARVATDAVRTAHRRLQPAGVVWWL